MDCRVCPWRTLPCPVMGRPSEFLQPLAGDRNACLSVRIVRSQHYYGESPHPFGLLRARRERPRRRSAAEGSQQFPPSDGACHTPPISPSPSPPSPPTHDTDPPTT